MSTKSFTGLLLLIVLSIPGQALADEAAGANLSRGKPYTLTPAPEYEHCTDEGDLHQLTDGKRVSSQGRFWVHKGCVGWQPGMDRHAEVIIDLGEVHPIDAVRISTGAGPDAGAYLPDIVLAVSDDKDGTAFRVIRRLETGDAPQQARVVLALEGLTTRGRHLLVRLEGHGVYVFCDEIEVLRGGHDAADVVLPEERVEPLVAAKKRPAAYNRLSRALDTLSSRLARKPQAHAVLRPQLRACRDRLEEAETLDEAEILVLEQHLAELQRRAMQALFPDSGLVVWQISPWTAITPAQLPAEAMGSPRTLRVVVAGNEYESAALMLTNPSSRPREVRVDLDAPVGWEGTIVLRRALPVRTRGIGAVADALPLLRDKNELLVPPWQSRQIWLQIHSGTTAPGIYDAALRFRDTDVAQQCVDLKFEVLPLSLPDGVPMATYSWQYVNRWPALQGIQEAAVADLAAHYTNVNILDKGALPWPEFDEHGEIAEPIDFTACDALLDLCRPISAKGTTWFLNLRGKKRGLRRFEKFTPEWRKAMANLISAWHGHLIERGFDYDDFFLYPYDETIRGGFPQVGALIRELDPNLRIFANPMLRDSDALLRAAIPVVDIWCPKLRAMFQRPRQAEIIRNTGKTVWSYGVRSGKRAHPYTDYRLMLWQAFQQGATGCGFWAYAQGGSWEDTHLWDDFNDRTSDFSVIYTLEGAPAEVPRTEAVIPSKRWEAWREGIEDHTFLTLLRERVAAAEPGSDQAARGRRILRDALDAVLSDPGDASRADTHRRQVLAAIVALNGSGRANSTPR